MRYLFIILLSLFAISAIANVYTYVDLNGTTVFTDTPPHKFAKNLKPEEISSNTTVIKTPYFVPKTQQSVQTTEVAAPTAVVSSAPVVPPYTDFVIASPKNQETIQNQPVINISFKVQPALQPGDYIQPLLDGAPWGPPLQSTSFAITRPDRGTHTLGGNLLSNDKTILKIAAPVTVFIHQAHLGNAP